MLPLVKFLRKQVDRRSLLDTFKVQLTEHTLQAFKLQYDNLYNPNGFIMFGKWMGYLAVWKVLEEMITDFRKRGVPIPSGVINDLKYARTLINVLKADPSKLETGQKIEEYLNNVESYLISEGQRFGDNYVKEWLKRLEEASRKMDEDEGVSRFVPGLPRDQRWIRVKPSDETPLDSLKALAEELKLSHEMQSDGYLLVYGEDERIKEFVKKMATKYGSKAGK